MKKFKILSLLLAVLLTLSGCQTYDLVFLDRPNQNVQNVEDGMISGRRTGILRQGISGQFKSFECTDERNYFLLSLPDGAMLYTLEHDSDEMEPLCAQVGCLHDGRSCGAWFGSNGNVCFYNEQLYVNTGSKLYQMYPDGSERVQLLDVSEYTGGEYTGFAEPKLWNGVFTYYLACYTQEFDEERGEVTGSEAGFTGYVPYYFKLDGSMDQPERMTELNADGLEDANLITQYNDGENFIMRSSAGSKAEGFHQLYTWNPESNESRWFADISAVLGKQYEPYIPQGGSYEYTGPITTLRQYEAFGQGYWGTEYGIYLEREYGSYEIRDNLVCKWDYASGTGTPLLRTGLTGAYRLCCFPDCFVLIKSYEKQGSLIEPPVMYLYNWEMEQIGVCYLDYEMCVLPQDVICGETGNRIYLASHFMGVPEYYIDKDELNGEAVYPHELSYAYVDIAAAYREVFGAWEALQKEEQEAYQQMLDEMQNQG